MISVIVPIYNAEKWICKCIDSVLNQSYRDIEVILVDDGSTDNSLEICEEYALKDKRVRVIHQGNQGALKARLNAISIANGDWISFVDSDDWIEPDMYEKLLGLAQSDTQIIWGELFLEYHDSRQIITKFDVRNDGEYLIKQILKGNIEAWMCNKLFKRELLLDSDIDMYSAHMMYEDIFWSIQIFIKKPRIIYTSQPFYHYNRTNEDAVTSSKLSDGMIYRKAQHNIKLIYEFLIDRDLIGTYINEFSVMAMRSKIAETNLSSITQAKLLYPFAHKKLSSYPFKSTLIRCIYWIYFNTGFIGNILFSIKRKIK